LTLREIGEKYDISRERVRQIEERVKRKLKAFLSKELKDIKSPAAGTG
jgi:RNA polymerase sigma-32 factor